MSAVILNSNSGANLNLIVELAKRLDIDVMALSLEEIEEIEDGKLLRRMEAARAGGLADRDEVFKELGR
ncbi:MAG: hypothetical protein LBV38_07805 [Alistipes sp.]|jgi:hypothetical protein|nr:hypothetical protein [Alistipes sp.]